MKKKEIIKPAFLDYSILGLIQGQPLSGFAIRKLFEQTSLGNYCSSPGTIYPALNRLQKFELVKESAQGKNGKTYFEITTNRILVLKNWFLKSIEKTDELLLRFGFIETLVDKKQRVNFPTSLYNLLNIYIKELRAFYDKESNNMPFQCRLAFQFTIDSNKTTLK